MLRNQTLSCHKVKLFYGKYLLWKREKYGVLGSKTVRDQLRHIGNQILCKPFLNRHTHILLVREGEREKEIEGERERERERVWDRIKGPTTSRPLTP